MKMFIVVRKDLDSTYRMVQGAHALAEYMLKFPNEWNNGTIVFVVVKNIWSMVKTVQELELSKECFATFHEPDLNDEATAIACYSSGEMFKKLQLVK